MDEARLAILALLPAASRPDEQGEPVAWAFEFRIYGHEWHSRIDAAKPRVTAYREVRNIRPLYAHPAPAAPRHAPIVEEIRSVLHDHIELSFRKNEFDPYVEITGFYEAARAICALLTTPERGEARGGFSIGDRVRKTRGSSWQGRVCGFYSTDLTPTGVCVESEREPGSVQIYPAKALALLNASRGEPEGGR
jgi:hypothetical protein